ncbi:hypothetical protein [Rhodobacter sp. NSM]
MRYVTAAAKDVGERDFDLVTVFDCLHDTGGFPASASYMREILKP